MSTESRYAHPGRSEADVIDGISDYSTVRRLAARTLAALADLRRIGRWGLRWRWRTAEPEPESHIYESWRHALVAWRQNQGSGMYTFPCPICEHPQTRQDEEMQVVLNRAGTCAACYEALPVAENAEPAPRAPGPVVYEPNPERVVDLSPHDWH